MWCLGKSQKLLTTNQYLLGTIFFTNMNISFFSLHFVLFSIITKKSQSNQEQCFHVLLCTHYEPLQCLHIFVNSKKSEFYGQYFQTMWILLTVVQNTMITIFSHWWVHVIFHASNFRPRKKFYVYFIIF